MFSEEEKNQNEAKNCVEKDINTDPWPGYRYTGKLRPYYPLVSSFFLQNVPKDEDFLRVVSFPVGLQTPMRLVPSGIQRPDYADHPRGNALLLVKLVQIRLRKPPSLGQVFVKVTLMALFCFQQFYRV